MSTTTALDAAALDGLVSAAVAAPSIHNSQPWRFRFDPGTATVLIRAARDRGLPHADPDGRALHVSIGAAVFNLRVAARHLGWEPVTRLLPAPDEPDILASVRLAPLPPRGAANRPDLYGAIWRRHTSRLPFADRSIPPGVLAELADAAPVEGAALHFPDRAEIDRLFSVTGEAERRNTSDPGRRAESRHWVHGPADGADGLPHAALGPQDASAHLPMRDFTALRPGNGQPSLRFEYAPTIAVLSTSADGPADWLRAGEALEHVLLLATCRGLRSSVLHQAMEWPDLRWALRDPQLGVLHVQMLVRLGYGATHPGTPRRRVSDVLEGGARRALIT